ncbi:MAG: hypothetical protein KIH01_09455 [Candidatus Freyarchaeota archaeon]|nr:hypothetical protein [Candidatus Jordarchaeia archaeon]
MRDSTHLKKPRSSLQPPHGQSSNEIDKKIRCIRTIGVADDLTTILLCWKLYGMRSHRYKEVVSGVRVLVSS